MASPHYPGKNRKIIEVTPDPDSRIEHVAPLVVRLMKEFGLDAEIHFPHFTLEVPQHATAADIVKAYKDVALDYLPAMRPVYKPTHRGPRFG